MFRPKRTMVLVADNYPLDAPSLYPAAEIARAWQRERPGTPTDSIEIVTPLWRLAKLFADDRRRVLADAGVDPATLDLLSVLRRAGSPYELSTRELSRRTLVTAGAISQRVARAEESGLVTRRSAGDGSRAVVVTLTEAGHDLVERTVDQVLTREADLVASLSPAARSQLAGQLQELLDEVAKVARKPSSRR
jgi:DNA-binding MarR family transcriptional regulator